MGIEFDIDVCAPPGGIPWIPAKRYFTKADDGLAQPWAGCVWMNPPYSQATPWAHKFIEHANGVCLVPWAKSAWTLKLWHAAEAIAMPSDGFFNFATNEGRGKGSISLAVFFAAFGDECVAAISRLGVARRAA